MAREDDDIYKMAYRWLDQKPDEDAKAIVLREATSENIMKAAAIAKQNAFKRLTQRLNRIIDKLSSKAVTDNVVKEIEQLRAVRQEAEQLFGPMAREEKPDESVGKFNFQLAFLTKVPSQLEEKTIEAKVVGESHHPATKTSFQIEKPAFEEFQTL